MYLLGKLIDAFIIHFNELHLEKTAHFVSYIVQFLSYLNLIFHASRRLLRLYSTIFDGLGRKRYSQQAFSRRGDGFENYTVHVCMFLFFNFWNLNIFKIKVSSKILILIELFYQSFYGENTFKVFQFLKIHSTHFLFN